MGLGGLNVRKVPLDDGFDLEVNLSTQASTLPISE